MDPRQSEGVVSLLKHRGDPREPWSITEIDRLPASAPPALDLGARALARQRAARGRLRPFRRITEPPCRWLPTGRARGSASSSPMPSKACSTASLIADWDGDGRDEILTASFSGIHVFKSRQGRRMEAHRTGQGQSRSLAQGRRERSRRGPSGQTPKFFCTIEPWHGNTVAVYLEECGRWQRHVIDDSLIDGHTLLAADLDGDGRDEIVAGFRGKGGSVWIYRAQDAVRAALVPHAARCGRHGGGKLHARRPRRRRPPRHCLHR